MTILDNHTFIGLIYLLTHYIIHRCIDGSPRCTTEPTGTLLLFSCIILQN